MITQITKIAILISSLIISSASIAADSCKSRLELDEPHFMALMLSLKLNKHRSIEKLLHKDCYSPNLPKNHKLFEHPIFNISTPKAFKQMQRAGADFGVKSRFGWDMYSTLFSYYIPLHQKTKYLTSVSKADHNDLLHFIPKGYLVQGDFDNTDFSTLGTLTEFEELSKMLIDSQPKSRITELQETSKQRNMDMLRITPLHYFAHHGNIKLFQYAMSRAGDKYNPNILDGKGQPLIASAINHYCAISNDDGVLKVIEVLLTDSRIDLEIAFKVNNESNIEVSPTIGLHDLLGYYKTYGEPKTYERIISLFQKHRPDFLSKNQGRVISKAITEDSMATDLCLNVRRENENYFDQP